MSYVKSLHHIVFNAYLRQNVISYERAPELYSYIQGIIREHKCSLEAIGGVPNHIHMLVDVAPMVALSDLVRDIKRSTSLWMRGSGAFPLFHGWAKEYYAASISNQHAARVKEYINNQIAHHKGVEYAQELARLAQVIDKTFDDRDMQ